MSQDESETEKDQPTADCRLPPVQPYFPSAPQQSVSEDFEMVDKPDDQSVSVLILGRPGVGKTALANAIAGKEVGKETEELESETTTLVYYTAERPGVTIEMWDSPGLQGNDTRDITSLLDDLREKQRQCDVVVYCVRMDAVRLEKLDIENINLITCELGVEFWNHTIVALTFANLVYLKCPPVHRQDNSSMEAWYEKRKCEWQGQIQSILSRAGVPENITKYLPVIPVGFNKPTQAYPNPWQIPCDKDWLFSFVSILNGMIDNDAFVMVMDELRRRDFLQADPEQSFEVLGGILGVTDDLKVTVGIAGGIGAGFGLATGAVVLGPVGAVTGTVVGAVGGALCAYTTLTAGPSDVTETDSANT